MGRGCFRYAQTSGRDRGGRARGRPLRQACPRCWSRWCTIAAMENQPKRALIVTRLSRVTEATTSPERQMEICQVLCDDR
ncbi:recombinase family protein, partial [Mycobacteroides abscessus subsp. abscessus]